MLGPAGAAREAQGLPPNQRSRRFRGDACRRCWRPSLTLGKVNADGQRASGAKWRDEDSEGPMVLSKLATVPKGTPSLGSAAHFFCDQLKASNVVTTWCFNVAKHNVDI